MKDYTKLTVSKNEESAAYCIRNIEEYHLSAFFMHVFTVLLYCSQHCVKIYCYLYCTIFYLQGFLLMDIPQKTPQNKKKIKAENCKILLILLDRSLNSST